MLTCATLNRMADRSLYFKCEVRRFGLVLRAAYQMSRGCQNLQKGGAFKARGACNAIFGLSGEALLAERTAAAPIVPHAAADEAASKGIVTHSSGNHAGAVAMVVRPSLPRPLGLTRCRRD